MEKLHVRTPHSTWMIASTLAAMLLHGLCWFIVQIVIGTQDAIGDTQRQMVLALAWLVGSLALWRLRPPPSRLHAILTVLVCALFVTVLGSLAALIKLMVLEHADMSAGLLQSFGMLGGLLVLAHLAMAIPSAILLQQVALTRPKPA
ncbi:hypothetical protein [Asticcacaulis solisilvae]|uniref:hypothetical protein n=1 Tax=Asticcacaulis solisilvae TaxID=1217274 RepID=UPI003FD6D18B